MLIHERGVLIFIFLFSYLIGIAQPTPIIIGQGKRSNIGVTSSNTQPGTSPKNTVSSEGFLPNETATSRFLQQATFGPTYEEILDVSHTNLEAWINQQFTKNRKFNCAEKVTEYKDFKNAYLGNPSFMGAFAMYWDYTFWEYTLSSEDLLRQRVALALSEILVISSQSNIEENPYPFATFYDILLDHSFGNYRQLLEAVTFHSAMGQYLTYINNPKQDTIGTNVIFPDENYAREIMQLFTIGLFELNINGTPKRDENDQLLATYDNIDIAELSKIFTGLTWSDADCDFGCISTQVQPLYEQPMVMNNDFHEPGPKVLVDGHTIVPRNPVDGVADINEALDHLFNHPNVGPFIGKQLIQRLVTSNPSPAYIARVAKAFNGESHYGTIRGDMKAVIKAILLDDEARNCAAQYDPTSGKLREPMLRYFQLCRSLKASSINNVYRNAMETINDSLKQKPFAANSVFNFFQTNYQPLGPIADEGLVAPEFQITDVVTISGYMKALNQWLIRGEVVDDWGLGFEYPYDPDDRVLLDFSAEIQLAENHQLPELIDRLNLILAHGQLTQRTKDLIIQMIEEIPESGNNETQTNENRKRRVQLAIYLLMTSPDYLVSR